MPKCNDCYYCQICYKIEHYGRDIETDIPCEYFCDSTKIISLPCKQGDTVYRKRKNSQIISQYNNVSLEWICKHIKEFGINCFTNLSDYSAKGNDNDIKCVDSNKIKAFAKEKGVYLWQIAAAMGISEPTMTRKFRTCFTEEEAQSIFDIILKLAEGDAE